MAEIQNQTMFTEKLVKRARKFEKFIGVIQHNQKLKEMNQEVKFKFDKLKNEQNLMKNFQNDSVSRIERIQKIMDNRFKKKSYLSKKAKKFPILRQNLKTKLPKIKKLHKSVTFAKAQNIISNRNASLKIKNQIKRY